MKILLLSIGTRGDMEPFLAIGEFLKKKGHQVICAFPEQFGMLAEESELEFASLGEKFVELLNSADGKAAMGGSGKGLKKFFALIRLAAHQTEANREMAIKQKEITENTKPDRIVYNGKAAYPILWELKNPGKTILLSALPYMHYVKGHTHIAFNSNFGAFFNKLTFSLAHFGMVTTTLIIKKWLKLPEPVSRKAIRNILKNNRAIYTISPSLFQRSEEWNERLQVVGYHDRIQRGKAEPDSDLQTFLASHEKILFITFGSMLNPDPAKKTRILIDILERNRIPAIINTASGGLTEPAVYDRKIIRFVPQISYGEIFPKMYAVIHHGGSGTTHKALKHGCASMIIPHILDQYVWNGLVSGLGVGPKGPSIGKFTTAQLEPRLLDLFSHAEYKKKAVAIGAQMQQEDLKEALYRSIID